MSEITSAHRVTRCGGLNFSAIGIIVTIMAEDSAGVACGVGALILGLWFWMLAINFHRDYMRILRYAASRSEEGMKILGEAGETSISLPDRFWRWLIRFRSSPNEAVAVPGMGAAPNPGHQADG
jgi:hypothetical protein